MSMITTGNRVNTPLGSGFVVGKESFFGGKLVRHLVRLDDSKRWAFGNQTDVAAFFGHELMEVCDQFLIHNAEFSGERSESAGTEC